MDRFHHVATDMVGRGATSSACSLEGKAAGDSQRGSGQRGGERISPNRGHGGLGYACQLSDRTEQDGGAVCYGVPSRVVLRRDHDTPFIVFGAYCCSDHLRTYL